MTMLAERVDFVIGVDTHKHRHAAAVIDRNGGVRHTLEVVAATPGYRQLLSLAEQVAEGCRIWAIEGTGSFGAGLASFLQVRGEWVIEIDRPRRSPRRRGKSDPIDAVRAAREALARDKLAQPRQRGAREALRILQTTREGVVKAQTRSLNQLHALVVGAPEELRAKLLPLSTERLLQRCSRLREQSSRDIEWQTYVGLLRRTAQRALMLQREAADYQQQIQHLARELAPKLLAEHGVGPICAAQILVAWSHHGRVPSEAAFAALSGTAPIPASSGQRVRHRFNPGGDRQLNRALHTVAVTRMRNDEETRAYVARRQSQGKTEREIRRCLKRYLARRFFKLLSLHGPNSEHTYGNAIEIGA